MFEAWNDREFYRIFGYTQREAIKIARLWAGNGATLSVFRGDKLVYFSPCVRLKNK